MPGRALSGPQQHGRCRRRILLLRNRCFLCAWLSKTGCLPGTLRRPMPRPVLTRRSRRQSPREPGLSFPGRLSRATSGNEYGQGDASVRYAFCPRSRSIARQPMSLRQKPSGPVDLFDCRVGFRLRLGDRSSSRRDVENPSAIGDHLPVAERRAGMENFGSGLCRFIQSANDGALLRRAGIAISRHHHCQRRIIAPTRRHMRQLPVGGGLHEHEQIVLQPRHQHLAFRVAEARVEFDQLADRPCRSSGRRTARP